MVPKRSRFALMGASTKHDLTSARSHTSGDTTRPTSLSREKRYYQTKHACSSQEDIVKRNSPINVGRVTARQPRDKLFDFVVALNIDGRIQLYDVCSFCGPLDIDNKHFSQGWAKQTLLYKMCRYTKNEMLGFVCFVCVYVLRNL